MSVGVLLKFPQDLALRLRYLQFDSAFPAFPLLQIKNGSAYRQAEHSIG